MISKLTVTEPLYDVIAVNIASLKERYLASNKTAVDAQATIEMAVIRRGVDVEFYKMVPTGRCRTRTVRRRRSGFISSFLTLVS